MGYIRQEQLPKLKEYKYSGVDKSLLSNHILKPYWWSQVVKLFPLTVAPNSITLLGFSFVIVNILTLLYYSPTLDAECPRWVYASWSIGLFLYQTLDAIDGTQARRTGQSGPLGELFDHGVDALNTGLEVLVFAACMRLGMGWRTVMVLFGGLLTFYVQTWDEYHTHTLTLGVVSGPVEGILILCIVYGITAYTGGSYWLQPMLPTLGVPKFSFLPSALYTMDFGDFYMWYGGIILLGNTLESCRNVMSARRARGQRARKALLGLLPFAASWALIISYLALNPTILHDHLVPFILYVALINAYSVGQMITAHLTKSRFPYQNVLALPLVYGVLDSLGPVLQRHLGGLGWPSALGDGIYQVAFMFTCLGFAVGVYGSFVLDVIVSICDYLDIWCLTIKHENVPKGEEKKTK